MKAALYILILCPTFMQLSCGKLIEGPLAVSTGQAWEVEYIDEGVDFYVVTREEKRDALLEQSLLMFSRWPPPGGSEKIPLVVDQIAKSFIEASKANEEISLDSEEPQKIKIEGQEFSGEAVVFLLEGSIYQTMFMISDGHGLWNGQFTGTAQHWTEALEILKHLKRKG